jgi:hypothetical protein
LGVARIARVPSLTSPEIPMRKFLKALDSLLGYPDWFAIKRWGLPEWSAITFFVLPGVLYFGALLLAHLDVIDIKPSPPGTDCYIDWDGRSNPWVCE